MKTMITIPMRIMMATPMRRYLMDLMMKIPKNKKRGELPMKK